MSPLARPRRRADALAAPAPEPVAPSRRRARALAAVALAAAALPLAAAPSALAGDWTVAEIDGPPGTTWIQPNAVNAHGVVVGNARFPGRSEPTAFRWEDGQMIELDLGGGAVTRAYDINDRGVIVGSVDHEYGAIWSATRTTSALSRTARNISGTFGSLAYGINELGQIVGSAGDSGNMPAPFETRTYDNRFPAISSGGGGWSRIMIPHVYTETENSRSVQVIGGDAIQINENGVVLGGGADVGGRARLGTTAGLPVETLEMLAGNQGLNDHGHVAGRDLGPTAGPFVARVWTGGGYVDVGAAQARSRANAINNLGWVVGRVGTEDYQAEYRQLGNAWLWRLDGEAAPLAVLGPTGWSYANALDVNDDGVIVGVGKHGSKEVGFMMTPAAIAHRVSGTVWGFDGAPVAGARVRVVGGAGQDLTPTLTTGADGRYETTLNRGTYRITVLPEGAFAPNAGAGCEISGVTCTLGLRQNRVVDFFGIRAPGGPGDRRDARTGADRTPPAIRGPRAGATIAATRGGVVGIALGPFAEAASGSVTLQQAGGARASAVVSAGAAAAKASGKGKKRGAKKKPKKRAAVVVLGRRSFRVAAGRRVVVKVGLGKAARRLLAQRGRIRAVAVVVARDAAGNTATKRIALTIRSAARAAKPRGRR